MRRRLSLVLLPFLLVSIVGSTSPSAADPVAAPIDCPGYLTVAEVAALPDDAPLTGFTVSRGTEPEAFDATLLGVMEDAIAPGRSMIVIEATSPAIDANGIWAGMSGSPVYHDDELIGAVAFGLSWGPSQIAGLTPAEDMFELPGVSSTTTTSTMSVPVTRTMRQRIAASSGTSMQETGDSMDQLRLPLAVSGGRRARERLTRAVADESLPFVPYRASSTASETLEATDMGAGDSLGAGLSFGDITIAAVGTTTFVCDGKAVGFGHPFTWEGRTTLGATGADALTVVGDSIGGSYKLANLTGSVGTVVQDRLAGIVADLGMELPAMATVSSETTALDLARTRQGETQVISQDVLSFLAYIHLLANIDSTFDQISSGSSQVGWTITGTRRSGLPWSLTRTNKYVSGYDIAWASVDEIYSQVYSLQNNGFERVNITDIDLTTSVEERVRLYRISKVLSSTNGTTFRDRDVLKVRRGQPMWFKIVYRGVNATPPTSSIVKMRAPWNSRGSASVVFRNGAPRSYFDECFFDECGPEEDGSTSFDDLLMDLATETTNDQVTASMRIGRVERRSRNVVRLDRVVRGKDTVGLRIVR